MTHSGKTPDSDDCSSRGDQRKPVLDIVVVNWNAGNMLAACIDSVRHSRNVSTILAGVTVVDNASTDDSIERVFSVADCRFRIGVIKNRANLGFGKACNQGSRIGGAELILFLNPDVVLESDTLNTAVRVMLDGDSVVGVCGVKLASPDGNVARTCARRPTAWSMSAYALGFGRSNPGRAMTYVMSEWDHAESRLVDHVIGAFYLVRRSAFEVVGGFDERFFMYLEDLDLSIRIADRGWKCLFVANAQAVHEGGGTSKRIMGKRLFYAVRSRLQYAYKHFGLPGTLLVSIVSLGVEPLLRLLVLLIRADFPGLRHTLEAYRLLVVWVCSGAEVN